MKRIIKKSREKTRNFTKNNLKTFRVLSCFFAALFFALPAGVFGQHRHGSPDYAPALNVALMPAPKLMTGKRLRKLPFDLNA